MTRRGGTQPNIEKRRLYVDTLKRLTATGGAPSCSVLAKTLGVMRDTAQQMLYVLEREGFVERGVGRPIVWKLTGKELPDSPIDTRPIDGPPRFDAGALADALDIRAFPVLRWTRTVLLGERRK